MKESGEAKATIACRIQSKKYPEYWGKFTMGDYSPKTKKYSLCIALFIDTDKGFERVRIVNWWLENNHKPTWNEVYEKLDQIIDEYKGANKHVKH